ncbi:hypothetical protein FKG94_06575 [Exilibacterium tricleocarpae]|uniref:Uncharacterized protein n=1 Tax=Exilibacterium tricleocarpae TaxID=2591008 RepID=A0A545TYU9_9GAMM|nr:hypothetical protein [Exilibacterium tricleocarpae]TQV82406.1 hypothetical protein FKG94_06575 [Exilibacterium tricleocarpae]
MSETIHAPPWLTERPFNSLEIFDPELADNAFHPKRYAWLTGEKIEQLLAPDTTAGQDAKKGFAKDWIEKCFWCGFCLLYLTGAWLTLTAPGPYPLPHRQAEPIRITLAPAAATSPASVKAPQPVIEAPAPPKQRPTTPQHPHTPMRPKPTTPALVQPKPAPSASAPARYQSLPRTPPVLNPESSAPAAPLRRGTTVFNPHLRQQLESAEVADLNTRRLQTKAETFTPSPTTEIYSDGKHCLRIVKDPVIGEMWISGDAGVCQTEDRVQRFGRQAAPGD